MYMDNGKLYMSSKSLETNVERLKEAYNEAEEWLKTAGLSPDYAKRELMHYTRRKNDGSPSITRVYQQWHTPQIGTATR